MHTPNLKDFLKLTAKGNVIPVYREINADLDTPVSAFLKLEKGDYSFLLESVEGQEKIARYSFLGTNPGLIFKSKGKQVEIIRPRLNKKESFIVAGSPLDEIKKIMRGFRSVDVPGLPRFYGGLVGYIGYDTVRFFENIPDKNKDELGIPDTLFILTDTLLIFDRLNHTIKILSNVFLPDSPGLAEKKRLYQQAIEKIHTIHSYFNKFVIADKESARPAKLNIQSNMKKAAFTKMVRRGQEYIKRGDIIQVVLSQRFKVRTRKDDFAVYRALRILNPSPYMYYLKLKDFSIVGSSPEMLVRCENGLVQTRPIAGTRRRGKDPREDLAWKKSSWLMKRSGPST